MGEEMGIQKGCIQAVRLTLVQLRCKSCCAFPYCYYVAVTLLNID